jgi:hypothetical protein
MFNNKLTKMLTTDTYTCHLQRSTDTVHHIEHRKTDKSLKQAAKKKLKMKMQCGCYVTAIAKGIKIVK